MCPATQNTLQDVHDVTSKLFENACEIIDQHMTEGYAQKNPALVSSIMNNQVSLLIQQSVYNKVNKA